MFLGHVAVAAIAKQTVFHERAFSFLLVASFAPDLIDKTGHVLFNLPGRAMGHSLFLFALFAIIICMVAQWLRLPGGLVSAGLAMWFFHIAGDFPQCGVLLWPLYSSALQPYSKFDVLEKLHEFYVTRSMPEQFWVEMFCVGTAISIFIVRSLSVQIFKDREERS